MEPDRFQRLLDLFQRAVALSDGERLALLEAECGDDLELRARLEQMLADDAAAGSFGDDLDELLASRRPDPLLGKRLGAYRILARIAAGGMGVVYRAERDDGLFRHHVAIKLVRADSFDEDAHRRFDLERQALAALVHPGIARLYDGGTTEEGHPYLVMELVEGREIDRYCREERLDLRLRLTLFAKVCEGVHFAHSNLIVHRDLKPGNILVDAQGEPKLLDFGIARFVDPARETAVTRSARRSLTPEYASPEQMAGEPITTATDVYSLGVVLYELLTGERPFESSSRSPAEWENILTTQPAPRPSTAAQRRDAAAEEFARTLRTTPPRLHRMLAGDVDRIVLMALRKEPERRYGSARELGEDLARHLAGLPVLARADSVGYRTTKLLRRHRLTVGSAALTFLGLLFGLVAALRGQRRAEAEVVHAQIEADSFDRISEFLVEALVSAHAMGDEESRAETLQTMQRQAGVARRQYRNTHLRANLLDALGQTCVGLGEFDEGEALLREALEMREAEFGPQSIEVALSLGSLGQLAYSRGQFPQAEEHLRRALELHRSCPKGTHTDVAMAANDLAAVLRTRGATDEAERLHREALELRRRGDPRGLPAAESWNNLAVLLSGQGRSEEARSAMEQALELRLEILGAEHPLTLQAMGNLSKVFWDLGERERARSLLERSLEGYRSLGAGAIDALALTLTNVAMIEIGEGRLDAADAHLEEAYGIQRERLGDHHPKVIRMVAMRASVHERRGEASAAEAAWSKALEDARVSGAPPALLAIALNGYGRFLCNGGRSERGEALLAEAVLVLESTPTPDLTGAARARLELASAMSTRRAFPEAKELMLKGIRELEARPEVDEEELERWRGVLAETERRMASGE